MTTEARRYWDMCCMINALGSGWYYIQEEVRVPDSEEKTPYEGWVRWGSLLDDGFEWLWDEMWPLADEVQRDIVGDLETGGDAFLQEWGEAFKELLDTPSPIPWPSQEWRRSYYYMGALHGVLVEWDTWMNYLEQPRFQVCYHSDTAPWQPLRAALANELGRLTVHPTFSPTQAELAQVEIHRFTTETVVLWRGHVLSGAPYRGV